MQALRALVNVLYPPACLLCHARLPIPPPQPLLVGPAPRNLTGEARQAGLASSWAAMPSAAESGLLCGDCAGAMRRSGPPVCARCGVAISGAFDAMVQCVSCRRHSLAFEMARAPWQYAGSCQEAIRQFKYHRRWRLGRWLAEQMVNTARASLPLDEVAAVLPVPLHWCKRWLKGWNPAEHLAGDVAQAIEKPCIPQALSRTRWTKTQTRLHGRERFRNVRRAFTARERLVRDRAILLVDDVLTSGATANACATALKEAGATRVFVLAAARTPLHDS